MSWIRYIFLILTFLVTGAVCLNAAESVEPNPWLLNLTLRKAGFTQRQGKLWYGWKGLRQAILLDAGLPLSVTVIEKTPDVLAPIAQADIAPAEVAGPEKPVVEVAPVAKAPVAEIAPAPHAQIVAVAPASSAPAPKSPPVVSVAPAIRTPAALPSAPPFVGGGANFRVELKAQPWPTFSPDWLVRLALVAVPYPITGTGDSVGGAGDTIFWEPRGLATPISPKLVHELLSVDGFVDENFGIYFGWQTHLAFHYQPVDSPAPLPAAPAREIASVETSGARTDVVSMLRRLCESRDYVECATLARFEFAAGNSVQALALGGLACEEGVIAGCEVRALVLAKLGRIDEAKEILKPICAGLTPCRSLSSIEPPSAAKPKK